MYNNIELEWWVFDGNARLKSTPRSGCVVTCASEEVPHLDYNLNQVKEKQSVSKVAIMSYRWSILTDIIKDKIVSVV